MGRYGNTVGSRAILSYQQQAIIVGKVLGDGCLEKNGLHVRLKIEQTDKQKEYVFWLYQKLQPFVGRSPLAVLHSGIDRHQTKRWRFATLSLPIFDQYKTLFYQNQHKIVPSNIISFLKHPLTLAIWYMDDGYLRTDKSGAYLCTSSFTNAEQQLLQDALKQNFELTTNVHFAYGYARLHIPSSNKEHFMQIIKPYVLACMQYKLL